MSKEHWIAGATAALVLGVTAGTAVAGPTLDAIKQRGTLVCGVHTGLTGFSAPDKAGKYAGHDVDFCKALAAAILGSEDKVKYVPLTAQQRFTALQSGEIDILSRNTTWNSKRDTTMGSVFAGVWFYDGQAFVVNTKKNPKVKKLADLNKASVCVETGTTTERNLADYARANKLTFKPVVFEGQEATEKAFQSGRCDAYTTDASGLYRRDAWSSSQASLMNISPFSPRSFRRNLSDRCDATMERPAMGSTSCAGPCSRLHQRGRTPASHRRRTSTQMLKSSQDPEIRRLTRRRLVKSAKGLGLTNADFAVRAISRR